MSKINFLADYLGDIQSYLNIVKEDYTDTLPEITIQRIEKDKIFFKAYVNANDPNHQEIVNEFREDIAGFLDKYVDEDEVIADMMFVEMVPKDLPIPEIAPIPTDTEDMQNVNYKILVMMEELIKRQPTVTYYVDWFNVVLPNGEKGQVQIKVTRDENEFR